jgi:hypothetical protein
MAESGFLQGLFLEEQLRNARQNQERQIAASREAQASSQDLAREQAVMQQNQFMQQMGMRQQELMADKQRTQFGQQLQLAGLFGNDAVRRPDVGGMSKFLDIGLPPQQTDLTLTESPDPTEPPAIGYTAPKFDSTFATAQMPAPEGTLMQIGDQQVLIPSRGQRQQEDMAFKEQEAVATRRRMIDNTEALLAAMPDLTEQEKVDLQQSAYFPHASSKGVTTYENAGARITSKYLSELAKGNKQQAAKLYPGVVAANKLAFDFRRLNGEMRMMTNPLPQLEVRGRTIAGQIFQQAAKAKPGGTAADVRNTALQMFRSPEFNSKIDPVLIKTVEAALQDTTFNPSQSGSVIDTTNVITGADQNAIDLSTLEAAAKRWRDSQNPLKPTAPAKP